MEYAGFMNKNDEFQESLNTCLSNIRKAMDQEENPDDIDAFMLEIGEAIQREPQLLRKANLEPLATVGNIRKFLYYFADKNSKRILTNVYRCKGDEADVAIVADVDKFNESWGDPHEDDAIRHVALSRGKRLLLTIGHVTGSNMERNMS